MRNDTKIRLTDLVVPKSESDKWKIGKVVGLKELDQPSGPILEIRDLITEVKVEALPGHVDKLVAATRGEDIEIRSSDLVAPKGKDGRWKIGNVIRLERPDLPIGPILVIRDLITGAEVEDLPKYVVKLVKASECS